MMLLPHVSQAEEAGLVFVFAFTFGAFLWGYLEYVA